MLKKSMQELQRLQIDEYSKKYSEGAILILDNIRSAHNVGSIFRTADCFGIKEIYLCGITSPIDHREVQKTALGAEISVPSTYFNSTIDAIERIKDTHTIIALEQTKNSILLTEYIFDKSKKYAFILGNEVEGVDENVLNLCHSVIEIPQIGSKHSLNVANTNSIILWEYFKNTTT